MDCKKRGTDVNLRIPQWHDFGRYVADDDIETATEEVAATANQPDNSYRCEVCNLHY